MIIAIPMVQGSLSLHFGHCEYFRLFTVGEDKKIVSQEDKTPPPHEPGVLPKWLSDEKANVIITGGMGMHAQRLFNQYGIEVVIGAPAADPKDVALAWLNGTLAVGANPCDH
jgi:predicted Fe-Mo cluster-binding NifX family protein